MSGSEKTENNDNSENVKRYLKYAGFILILAIGWYALDIAGGL
jgi:hypothetical protein